ncbi:MAG TPA: aldehyde dehydrogenase family protein, partial [Caulobacterales bacterium]|nr:aldehyde dehydrogenase family protein [Caulobacterales bacterium]
MQEHLKFYIDGAWVDPVTPRVHEVINPATEEPVAKISLGSAGDVDKAVAAARRAFETYSKTSREERIALLEKIIALYEKRIPEIGLAVSSEMGAPMWLATAAQAGAGLRHFQGALGVLKTYNFEEAMGKTRVVREPIGVCGLITPWNWPLNQIVQKVAPALAAGCTMILKPSELSPLNAIIVAEVLHEAGVPKGVFNLVNGDGPGVGAAMSAHPGIDMVSFTGSTRAGVAIAKAAADTVKRVTQELGGKSANIILDDADLEKAVASGTRSMMGNSGQTCVAPSRMFVPRAMHDKAAEIAAAVAKQVKVLAPDKSEPGAIGPLANANQFAKVQGLIQKGIDEGATLVAGGVGRPDGLNRGYYVRPTVFANATNDMTIAREEIFGPVLTIIPYDSEDHAVEMANDTVYGLSGYVQSGNLERARKVAKRMRTGMVNVNGGGGGGGAPFGGYKQSGNGREGGVMGLEEYLETKSIFGY